MNCSPVYFNMTRWALAYGGPVAAWTDAVVDAYVNQIAQHALGNAALTARRRANAQSDNLLYIPPAAVGQCGVGQALFARPVGSAQGAAGDNGQTRLDVFHCVMNAAGPPPPFPPAAHPYFAIIDSNAAHHTSALLVARAFAGLAAGWARVVINFDAHADFGAQLNLNSFRCDNWGIFTVRSAAPVFAAPIADFYVGLGNRLGPGQPPWSTSFYRMRPPAPAAAQPLLGATVTLQTQALLAAVNQQAVLLNGGPWAGIAAYVTVDRDVLQASFTDYGDGSYAPLTIHHAVRDCLQVLQAAGVTLSAFDVCGLPTWNGASVAHPAWSPAQRQQQAYADIHAFNTEVVAY